MKSREFMAETLRELQKIQMWAYEHGIFLFQIGSTISPLEDEGDGEEGLIRKYGDTEERFIYVDIFRTKDVLSSGNYGAEEFGPLDSYEDFYRKTLRIKSFIGMEE